MKNTLAIVAFAMILFSCKNEPKTEEKQSDSSEVAASSTNTTEKEEGVVFLKVFDWSKIANSSSEIGSFPYISAPDGFVIKDEYGEVAKNGMTAFSDFSKLIMYNGKSFFNAEGKKAEMRFAMTEKHTDFNQFKFDKSVENYLEGLGAVLLFKGQIPKEYLNEINKDDDKTVFKYIQGDPWNSSPVKHYVLNHNGGKIMFQVWSNSASGEVGVVALEGFKQTIKAPTASEMQKEIETSGKAILNINFDTDKATLKPDGLKIVDEIALLLNNNPSLKLSIEGHTDNTGTTARNKELSGERANTVMYSLAAKGIAISRLKAAGFGSEKPLVPNDSDDNKAKNRRVELVKF